MAVSAVVVPENNTPAYNPIVHWVDSTNKNETGFKYVVDVYDASATKIAEYRVAPRIDDGYGVIDLSKLLQSQVTKDLNLSNTTYYDASNCYFKYDVKFGEEYNASYAYTGFGNSGGYVQLTGFSSHPFAVGDQIDLTEGTPTNALLDGLHTVTAVAATTVTLDILYADLVSPSSTAGEIIYADNRKSITRDLLTYTGRYVFNGALPWLDFRTYSAQYNNSALFLANVPSNFYIRDDADAFLHFHDGTGATRRFFFENSNGDTFYKDVTSTAAEWIVGASCGAGNLGSLTTVSGTPPLIQSDTTYYDVTIVDGTNTPLSNTIRFNLDLTCEIESFDILFMDRLGSWMPFSFTLKAFENGTITKSEYNQDNQGSASGTDWTYETTDRGMKVLTVDVNKQFTLNTNWMTLEMNQYFEELLTSPETYIKIDGTYQACIIKENSFETTRQRGRKLIRKTIKVELANRDSING
jgi:hypothetical protein